MTENKRKFTQEVKISDRQLRSWDREFKRAGEPPPRRPIENLPYNPNENHKAWLAGCISFPVTVLVVLMAYSSLR